MRLVLFQELRCSDCSCNGPNLWFCLLKDCGHVGCSEKFNDHSTIHFKSNADHCVHINLSTKRIWCYICETEVFFHSAAATRQPKTIVYDASDDNDEYPYYHHHSSLTSNQQELLHKERSVSTSNVLPQAVSKSETN